MEIKTSSSTLRKGGSFIGEGATPANAGNILFMSVEQESVPETGWKEEGGRHVDTMRVTKVTKAFAREEMMHGEEKKEEGLVCSSGSDNQTLFITKNGDPYTCDGHYNCESHEGERFCNLFTNLSMEKLCLTT